MANKNINDLIPNATFAADTKVLGRANGQTEDQSFLGSVIATFLRTTGLYGTVGQGISIKEGTNAKAGVATLVAGTVTVANTSVTATSRIKLTVQSLGTVTRPAAVGISARTAGTSFTIMSGDVTDTSVVYWEINENT